MNKKLLLGIGIPVAFVTVCTGAFFGYACSYYEAQNVEQYFEDSNTVAVKEIKNGWLFDGKGTEDALIFYPGAKVDEKAYAPICRMLAEEGVDVFLTSMPFHMAIFDTDRAETIRANYTYTHWYIGGHSMGGAMAASYLASTQTKYDGIIFFAAYSINDFSGTDLKALSLYGSNDGVVNAGKIENGREYFSQYTEYVIEGGNHALFGSYGVQSGDHEATITHEAQWTITVEQIIQWIK